MNHCQGLRGGTARAFYWGDERVLELDEVTVAQHWECAEFPGGSSSLLNGQLDIV